MNMPFANPAADSAVNVREIVSPRGLRAWLVEDYAVPIVALEFAIRGGATQDPTGKAGAAAMIAGLLDEGAGDLDSQAFQRALDEKAVELSFHADRDYLGGRMRTLGAQPRPRRRADAARDQRAALRRGAVRARARADERAAAPRRQRSRPPWRARPGASACSPATPTREPSEGEIETLAAIELDDLKAHARDLLTRAARSLSPIVGAISPERAAELVDELFAGLPAEAQRSRFPPRRSSASAISKSSTSTCRNRPSASAVPALTRDDPDYMASVVLAHVLGGGTGLSSRLFREVREKRGLAYSVSASIATFDHAAYLYGGTTTKNERAHELLDVIRAEILDMARGQHHRGRIREGQEIPDRLLSAALRHLDQDRLAARPHPARRPWRRMAHRTQPPHRGGDDGRRPPAAERLFGDGALSVTMVGRPERV